MMKKTNHVYIAQPYKSNNMGSMGNANEMLIVQNNFPLSFYDIEKIVSQYLDRIEENYSEKCLKKYKFEKHYLDSELRRKEPAKILAFITEVLKQEPGEWTGYRVLGTVGGNGHPYYCFQLFAKHPNTDTEVYSGDIAPNVKPKVDTK